LEGKGGRGKKTQVKGKEEVVMVVVVGKKGR